MIGWNDQNQLNKQFSFNPNPCGGKGGNTERYPLNPETTKN